MGFQNSSNPCHLFTTQMALSGGKADSDRNRNANIFISRSCNSANPCVWRRGGYVNMARGDWFLVHNGFYGGHASAYADYTNFKNYLKEVKFEGIGSKWLALMNTPHDGGLKENCPVSIVYCDEEENCDRMFYHGGARDFKDTGETKLTKLYYILDCDPDGSEPDYAALGGD